MATKTINEQLRALYDTRAKTNEKIMRLEAAHAAQKQLDSIAPGSVVRFVFGRKETRGEYSGEVRSIIDTEKGKVIRVIKGEGAEEEIVSIKPSDILAVGEEVQEAPAQEYSAMYDEPDEAPQAEQGGAAADPLANLV